MDLSIIVPAYNEELRIKEFADSLINFSAKHLKKVLKNYEIIFVNDGSKDSTLDILQDLKKAHKDKIKIISYEKNQGKGYAVKKGVLNSKGEKIIFIDADGSISPKEIPKMLEKLNHYDIVIGNRSSKQSKIEQPGLRVLTGTVFSIIANIFFPIKTKDTVCGFKGFNKNAAVYLFEKLKSTGWVFDVEIIYLAKKKKYSMYKLPIIWKHKQGTRMKLYTPILMVWELVKLRVKI